MMPFHRRSTHPAARHRPIRMTALWLAACCTPAMAQDLPRPDASFNGVIKETATGSTPDWPRPAVAPKGAPNILLILLDDVGFADTSPFGGAIATPALEKLAGQGLSYNQFYTTAMCSPTRASLLTGRNHHRVGFGRITNIAGGYPGYDSVWKRDTASIARVLRDNGYGTAAFGKWHNTPLWETTPVGPFDRWPTGLGFEHFYGFLAGSDDQLAPRFLYQNTLAVDAPVDDDRYHFTTDITDRAIRWIKTHEGLAPAQPWFAYFATGATHAPHQPPKAWVDRYRGKFDQGWDKLREEIFARQKRMGIVPAGTKLTPRPPELPAWASLSPDERKLFARQMEIYAAYLAHTDHEIGRLIDVARQGPNGQNTLIIYVVGDNGPSGMYGPTGTDTLGTIAARTARIAELGVTPGLFNNYSSGWAWAGSTPFEGSKGVASHLGGLRDAMVISWPAAIKGSGMRSQFAHVNDIAPTIYEAAKITPPAAVDGIKQAPMDGVSLVYSFDRPTTPAPHRTQYFEMWGNRAVYQDGWFAAARHTQLSDSTQGSTTPPKENWELYDLRSDFSQSRNIAASHPAKLASLRRVFQEEARKNLVFPIATGGFEITAYDTMPLLANRGQRLTLYPGMEKANPFNLVSNAPAYRVVADLDYRADRKDGMLFQIGGANLRGHAAPVKLAFGLEGGRIALRYAGLDRVSRDARSALLAPGENRITIEFDHRSGGSSSEGSVSGKAIALVNAERLAEIDLGALRMGGPVMAKGISIDLLKQIVIEPE